MGVAEPPSWEKAATDVIVGCRATIVMLAETTGDEVSTTLATIDAVLA
jgi:hypothetical protein